MGKVANRAEAFWWSVSRIAEATGMDRRTVTRRLSEAGVLPVDEYRGHPRYELRRALPALYIETSIQPGTTPDDMMPTDRRAWYQSENERIKLEKEMRLLVPVEEVHREMSRLARNFVGALDRIPDDLERNAGLTAEVIESITEMLEESREGAYRAVIEEDDDLEEAAN